MRAKHIQELVKIVEDSNINELEITKWWGRKVRISKTGSSHAQVISPQVYAHAEPKKESVNAEPVQDKIEAKASSSSADSSNLIEIKSPMVGTFYRAPAPDADPYVKQEDTISPGSVLCIIEAMKLMNEIEAEISGRIAKVLVENAQPVEFNQPLFLVEPS